MSSGCSRPIHTRRFWAKARPYGQPRPEKIHLLEHHLADVGACFEALLAQPTIRRRLARSGGLDTLDDVTSARLALFAAMHDVGKVNVGFQTLVWADGDHPGGRRPGRAGHYNELAPVLANKDHETADWFFDALGWWWDAIESWDDREGETVCGLFVATLSHHGRPLALDSALHRNSALWREYGGLRPREQVERIGGLLRRWFPDDAFNASAPRLPSRPAFQHMFLGLCTWADWIGSNERWFPYVDEPDDDYFFKVARPQAARAIREMGLDVGGQREALGVVPDFGRLFGADLSPNAIQRAALDAPLDTPVVIVESETGSGKTEAALWRFARMYEKGLVDGIYFALPTRAAAKQIHDRVERFVAKLFPNKPPPVVLAVPGYEPGEDAAASAMADYDEGAAGHQREGRAWAAESPKRYLAAQVAVGTVDQAMMAALKVKHSHMRAACLARNLLVVDEVHASDTYMGRVIEALLDAHTGSGGYALLMSATLGSAARHRWLNRGRSAGQGAPLLEQATKTPYPAVSGEGIGLTAAGLNDQSKRVFVEASATMGDFADTARRALEAARAGAKVLVVRNTVGYAISTQRALEELAGAGDDALLFGVEGVTSLHHGRFAACDRAMLDARIEELLGKDRRGGGRVVVGTQTLEQSLDIDADLLITDLCPADVLLQRIGRLHRHPFDRLRAGSASERPEGFADARCVVLTPDAEDMSPLLASGENANGLGPRGFVYPDLRVLETTLRLVRERGEWRIPQMNRELVERATHPDALAEIVEELGDCWAAHANDITGGNIAEGITASYAIVRRDAPFFSEAGNRDVLFPSDEERIRTRLGDDRVDIALDPPQPSPFNSASRIDRLAVSVRWLPEGADTSEPVAPTPTDGGFVFAVGERRFVYDRLGLRRLDA